MHDHLRGSFAPARDLLVGLERTIRAWDGASGGRVRVAVAPVIPNECSDELLQGCGTLVRDYGVLMQSHVAESKVQAIASEMGHGQTVVERLGRCGLLGPRSVAGHAVWVTDEDIRLLAATGTSVAHNPASNLRLGSGIAPVRELLDAGICVGLGSDGSLTSDNQNMFEAMRFAGTVGTIRFGYRADRWVGARDVWRMATSSGAVVVGQGDTLGRVEEGRKAVLIILRTDSTTMTPLFSPLNALVYAQSGSDIQTVLASGQVVMDRGVVTGIDEAEIIKRAAATLERAKTRHGPGRAVALRLAPYVRERCFQLAQHDFPVDRYAR